MGMEKRLGVIEGSSNLSAWGWEEYGDEPGVGTLTIEFHDGGRWYYAAVPLKVVEELVTAESKGRYFLEKIRDVYASMPATSSFEKVLDKTFGRG